MAGHLLVTAVVAAPADPAARAFAAVSGRLAYVALCLALCWGVLAATGWAHKLAGRPALRGTHEVLATFALVMAIAHAVSLLVPERGALAWYQLLVPFTGPVRHGLGVVGLELALAVAATAALHSTGRYRDWRAVHRLSYAGVWLCAMHAWLGAAANGTVALVWLGGITALVPAITLTVLRFLPPPALARLGLVEGGPAPEQPTPEQPAGEQPTGVRVAVDHARCHHFALCQSKAPVVFRVLADGRLRYARNPDAEQAPHVRAAARACPMRAIRVDAVGLGS